jgi:mRNA interferase MazF
MESSTFGKIVLIRFPFADGNSYKRRPALLINDFNDGDILVCRITSQIYKTKYDLYIDDWKESGLKLPSVIRVHKLATLEKDMVEIVMGKIDEQTIMKVRNIFTSIV